MRVPGAPTWSTSSWWLRGLTGLLPVVALLVAWPELPSAWVWLPVLVSSLRWALRPEDVAGAVALTFVVVWWGVHLRDALVWQVGVVAVLVLAAHVAATLASHGPAEMGVGRDLVVLWVRRAGWAAVPAFVVLAAGLAVEAAWLPTPVWTAGLLVVLAALVTVSVTARSVGSGQPR